MPSPSPAPLVLSNLDFEVEWERGSASQTKRGLLSTMHRWRAILRLIEGLRRSPVMAPDLLSQPQLWKDRLPPTSALHCWGHTPRTHQLAQFLGLEGSQPELAAVRQVNSKLFSHHLEQQLGLASPGAQEVSTWEALQETVAACPARWVLKHPFGFAGQGRVVGPRGQIPAAAEGWAKARWKEGWTLLFEPWVEEARCVSWHFEIPAEPQRPIRTLGRVEQLTDAHGVHRGHRLLSTSESARPSPTQLRIVDAVRQAGYWGWLGMDTLCRDPDHPGGELRPLLELNARCTFGRLALALPDWLPPHWSALWWHPRRQDPELAPAPPLPSEPEAVRPGRYALPELADPGGSSGSFLLVAPDPEGLTALAKTLGHQQGRP